MMLNIFYGRENLDKSKFIFEHIEGRTLLIVPDQFTLQAERDAFFYLNKKAVTDVDVMSFSRLGHNVMSKTGGRRKIIEKEGRQMLLTKLVRDNKKELEVFGGSSTKQDFIALLNDFISDMKQHEVTLEMLEKAVSGIERDSLLKRKLKEVLIIFESYEKAIDGKYLDSEDYIGFFAKKIKEAPFIKDSSIWIYGFDSFTEKNLTVIRSLEQTARNINLVLTWDEDKRAGGLFDLTGNLILRFKNEYRCETTKINDSYKIKKSDDIVHLEKELYALPPKKLKGAKDIKLVRAANPYSQAASAAAYVKSLARDFGYRYKDIALVSNDLENSGHIYKRVFAEYGLELFIDKKRDIFHQPAVTYLMTLLDMILKHYQREDVLKYIKTGLVTDDKTADELEIYTEKYGVKGGLWLKEFKKGVSEYGEEKIAALEEVRKTVIEPVEILQKELASAERVTDKVQAVIKHMENRCGIPEKLEELAILQERLGELELAEETVQLWEKINYIFAQMEEIIGEEKVSQKEFAELLKAGLKSVEIGLIPPAVDGLVMGSMQRTRRGDVRALVVLDACEGMLPVEQDGAEILSEDEKEFLASNNIKICSLKRLMSMEENMAIYRNLAAAREKLYLSYAASDNEGGSVEPSSVFLKLEEIFDIKAEADIFERACIRDMIGGKESAANNMIAAVRTLFERGSIDESWRNVFAWFSQREDVNKLTEHVMKRMQAVDIGEDTASLLYKQEYESVLKVSPSRLEKFGRCPFAHFLAYGLHPEEIREYKVGAPEAGSIYHRCLMEISKELSSQAKEKNLKMTDDNSPWMTVTREDVDSMISEIIERISEEYKEGILSDGNEGYYRAERIKKVCEDSVWMAIKQVRKGKISDMLFEAAFGENKQIPPITINNGSEEVLIEGQIDRCDITDSGYSKVIDYKSGADKYIEEEARVGIKLQLFIYLMATAGKGLTPGGAFYFHVDDASVRNSIEPEKDAENKFKMDGFAINDNRFTEAIDPDAKIYINSKKRMLEKEEFDKLISEVMDKVKELANGISKGEIGIKPKKVKDYVSCTYCPYKGICKFDLSIDGCRYNMI